MNAVPVVPTKVADLPGQHNMSAKITGLRWRSPETELDILTCPERNEIHRVEHSAEDACYVRDIPAYIKAQDEKESEGSRANDHGELGSGEVRLAEKPPRKDDRQDTRRRGRYVEQLIPWKTRKAETGRYRRQLPLETIATEIHQNLRQAEGIRAWILQGLPHLSPVESWVLGSWSVVSESELEIRLLSWGEPFRRSFGFGVIWKYEVDDSCEEYGEQAFQEIDPRF